MVEENKIPEGYKESEVGIIPCDWSVIKFTDCADLKHGFQFRDEHFSKDGIIVTKIGNLVDGAGLKLDDVTFIPKERYKQFARYTLYKGDVLMALTGATLGKVSRVDTEEITLQNYRVGNFINKRNTTKNFIYYLLQSSFITKTTKKLVNEAAQPNLGKQDFDKFLVPLPSAISEQVTIAIALSDVDALIENLEKLIVKKRNIKQGAMQELLTGRKRVVGYDGEWEVKKLGDIAEVVMGQSPKSEFYNSRGIGLPLVQGNADVENRKTIIHTFTSEITKKGRKGAIIMSVRAPVGEISKATFDCCLGRGVCAISYKNDYLSHYLIYFEKSWARLSTGSTFDSVNSAQVRNLEIPIPTDEDEQTAIATVLNDMDFEIEAIEQKLHKYRMVKQGMMQVLLTGKIRII